MQLFLNTTIAGLQMGFCFALLALGLYISYSILDFSDLSVDGTFPLGGIFATILMYKMGVPPIFAVLLSFFIGALAGSITGILHVKFKISKLLSGIIVMTGLLSVTLAMTTVLSENGYPETLFSYKSNKLKGLFDGKIFDAVGKKYEDLLIIGFLLLFAVAAKLLLDLFLKTKLGYMLRATGDNENVVTSMGKDTGTYKITGLMIANGLVAVSGALYAQLYGQYDNTCGSGKVVLALASVIIGMAIFRNSRIVKGTTACIIGALIYSLCLNYLVLLDKNGIYLKLLNAVLFALILIFNDKISNFSKGKKAKDTLSEKAESYSSTNLEEK